MFSQTLAAVLVIWIALSVVVQFHSYRRTQAVVRLIRKFDPFGLVPCWTFYAPMPLTAEFLLLVRYFDATEKVMRDWVVLRGGYAWRCMHAVFNPLKNGEKAFIDYVLHLRQQVALAPSIDRVQLTVAYLTFLGMCVTSAPPGARLVQFMIARREADVRKKPWSAELVSSLHEI